MKRSEHFFQKMFEDPRTHQMNWPKMFRKKSLSDDLSLLFFFESSESDRFFFSINLHDSNSIFRAVRIISEWVSGGTVVAKWISLTKMKELHACVHEGPRIRVRGVPVLSRRTGVERIVRRMAEVPEGKRRKPSRVIQDVSNSATDHCGGFRDKLWKSEEGPAAQSAGSSGENTGECSFRECGDGCVACARG